MPYAVSRAGHSSRAVREGAPFERSRSFPIFPGLVGLLALINILATVMSLGAI
jgi:hypothetical protein